MFNQKLSPVPVESLMDTIATILQRGIGSRFDLEISEKNTTNYHGKEIHLIELNLKIEEDINEDESIHNDEESL